MRIQTLLWAGVMLLAACGREEPAAEASIPPGQSWVRDEVTGISLTVPVEWSVKKDPALFDTYGFFLYAPTSEVGAARTGHARDAVAHLALAYRVRPSQLEERVQAKLAEYAEFHPVRTEVPLADGRMGIALSGLPGPQPYSVVYASDGERVYELGLWTDEPGLDARARTLLASIRFEAPSRSVESLGLPTAEQALHVPLPPEQAALSARAAAERREQALAAMARGELPVGRVETREVPVRSMQDSCGFTAPSSLYWQLQWDGTNTFYSGAWYDMREKPGWSAMSGNYGSWWGSGFHVRKCDPNLLNQFWANDWPAQYGANAYAAFSGYVEWAAWGTDGFKTLGRFVVVRSGGYRSLTAHLRSIEPGITWGTWIDGYWTVIGHAGDSGESYAGTDWAPHLHARVAHGEKLTANGQPYGGESVKPLRLRCFNCNNPDVAVSGDGGYYNDFFHGRWMMY